MLSWCKFIFYLQLVYFGFLPVKIYTVLSYSLLRDQMPQSLFSCLFRLILFSLSDVICIRAGGMCSGLYLAVIEGRTANRVIKCQITKRCVH
jgi:hypothetical protein